MSIYSRCHDPLELLRSKNNSKLRCFRLAAVNRVLVVGFGSLKGQSTDGRWQAPDRVPFRKVPFPKIQFPLSLSLSLYLSLCLSFFYLPNLSISITSRILCVAIVWRRLHGEMEHRVRSLTLAPEPTTNRIIQRRSRSNRTRTTGDRSRWTRLPRDSAAWMKMFVHSRSRRWQNELNLRNH